MTGRSRRDRQTYGVDGTDGWILERLVRVKEVGACDLS